jgi:hypothetical protein
MYYSLKLCLISYKKRIAMSADHENLMQTKVYLEEDVLEALAEFAAEYSKEMDQNWSRGTVIGLANNKLQNPCLPAGR